MRMLSAVTREEWSDILPVTDRVEARVQNKDKYKKKIGSNELYKSSLHTIYLKRLNAGKGTILFFIFAH